MTRMVPDGDLETEQVSTGQWRFTYTTPGGALYLGPVLYKSKAAARRAGNKWLAENQA